ncbi:hypothetical protein [Micromonospora sp. NPDC005113]
MSFEVEASRQSPLLFQPPLIDRAPQPDAFEYVWRLLTFVFPFKDPARLPPLLESSLAPHREILNRYCQEAGHLAESQYLSGPAEVRISFEHGAVESIESSFQSKEITRGFGVTFRQFYSTQERAAFVKVHNVIAGIAKTEWGEGEEWDQLMLWRAAHAKLQGRPLKVLVGQKLWPQSTEQIADDYPPYPQQLISAYFYGDLIHYGDKAQDLSALRGTPFDAAWSEWRLGEAVSGLAHLYRFLRRGPRGARCPGIVFGAESSGAGQPEPDVVSIGGRHPMHEDGAYAESSESGG